MIWQERITLDPAILTGKAIVRGTRISVELVVDLLAAGWTHEQILASYPGLKPEDIQACLQYASDLMHSEEARAIMKAKLSMKPMPTTNLAESIRRHLAPFDGVELVIPERDAVRQPPKLSD